MSHERQDHEEHAHKHEETFAEGQELEEHHPEEEPHGDFARGQEHAEHEHEGTFGEGQAQEDHHPEHEERGDFAEGQERTP